MKSDFEKICRMTQERLIHHNIIQLDKAGYTNVIQQDGFIFAEGEIPVLLVAHMDTVHRATPKIIEYKEKGNILTSPNGIGGDDRCGIYMIHEIIKTHKCHVLFTEDEEIGGIGTSKFIKSPYLTKLRDLNINYMIELDRKGNNDAVFYECANPNFIAFVTESSGLKEACGSYTDICDLMPEIGIAGVNISCGYYNAHQLTEYVVFNEMETQIDRVKNLISEPCEKPFEFIDCSLHDSWFEDYYPSYKSSYNHKEEKIYYIEYYPTNKSKKKNKLTAIELEARSKEEAVGLLLMNDPELTYSHISEIYEE